MADTERKLTDGKTRIDFQTDPTRYRHWKLAVDGDVATLPMDVDEKGGLFEGYELQAQFLRSRRRHRARRCDPAIALRASAGAGGPAALRQAARVLRRRQYPDAGEPTHAHKVNFCKFTNETRTASRMRARPRASGPSASSTAPRRAAAMSSRSRPTRSCWSTTARRRCRCRNCRCSPCCRGPAGSRASPTSARYGAIAPTCSAPPRRASRASAPSSGGWSTRWAGLEVRRRGRRERARSLPRSQRARWGRSVKGIALTPLKRERAGDAIRIQRGLGRVERPGPARRHHATRFRKPRRRFADAMVALGADFSPLRLARELDDAILDIRVNEFDVAAIVFKSAGDRGAGPGL